VHRADGAPRGEGREEGGGAEGRRARPRASGARAGAEDPAEGAREGDDEGARSGSEVTTEPTLTVCPNCDQWQRPENGGDCLNRCKARGFAPKEAKADPLVVEVEITSMQGALRPVEIPADELARVDEAKRLEAVLDLAFRYGQNDFQPRRFYSVSVGDVVRYNGRRFRVLPLGFEEV
jgi:hypothetical protein